jgi:hypothetical protein
MPELPSSLRARRSPTPRSGFVQRLNFGWPRPSRKVQTLGGIAGGRSISSCFSSFPSGMSRSAGTSRGFSLSAISCFASLFSLFSFDGSMTYTLFVISLGRHGLIWAAFFAASDGANDPLLAGQTCIHNPAARRIAAEKYAVSVSRLTLNY